jgi:hypothetical protein
MHLSSGDKKNSGMLNTLESFVIYRNKNQLVAVSAECHDTTKFISRPIYFCFPLSLFFISENSLTLHRLLEAKCIWNKVSRDQQYLYILSVFPAMRIP